jgi:hypothetical protein
MPAEQSCDVVLGLQDPGVVELADCVNKVVNTFVKNEDKRHKELCDGAFLKRDAVHILHFLGFGLRI